MDDLDRARRGDPNAFDSLARAHERALYAHVSRILGPVESALTLVPVEQRDALLLRDVEGFSYEEIATITVSEIGTVKSRIFRGRLAVRNELVRKGWRGSAG